MGSVPKVRGLLWREHPLGSQTHPITKSRGDWWISWKCRNRHRHREKVGPRGLAVEEYHRRRTQSRREGFCPRLQKRSVATLFEDLAARWLRDHARVVKRSWRSDRHRIETLKSQFGRSTLTEITPDRVDRYRSDRLTTKRKGGKMRTISPTTVNKEVALLKAMLNRAIAWGLLDTNPILRVKKLPEPEGRVRYLAPEEIERLLAACPPHLRSIVVCALHTGMRRGEILGLTWDCVDMKNRMIRVTGTKSGKSRGIPINDPLLEELRRLPRHLKTDYVFWNHETETRFVSIKKVWATTLRKVGIANFRFHDLRHTFASYVQMGLGDLRATQVLLGHADPRMTQRYAHLSDERLREAVRALSRLPGSGTRSGTGHASS
jgi:integrase